MKAKGKVLGILLLTLCLVLTSCPMMALARTSVVRALSVEPITVIENAGGEAYWGENEETGEIDLLYYEYDLSRSIRYTVTWQDGTQTTSDSYALEHDDEWYLLEVSTNQEFGESWEAGGTYAATVTLDGVSVSVPVTVVESPIQSLSVEPITVIEHTDGYWWEDYNPQTNLYDLVYYQYDIEPLFQYTITWKDGKTTTQKDMTLEYQGEYYWMESFTNQSYDTAWTVGNTYTIPVMILGKRAQTTVSVVPTPIRSVSFEPLTLMDEIDGYMDYDYDYVTGNAIEYRRYDWGRYLQYRIEWNDGTATTGKGLTVEYQGREYALETDSMQSGSAPWLPGGMYCGSVSIVGYDAEAMISVVESPITRVDVVEYPSKTSYQIGEWICADGLKLRVNYKDGSYENVVLDESKPIRLKKYARDIEPDISNWRATAGLTSYTVSLFGRTFTVPVTVSPYAANAVSIRADGADLFVTLTFTNGTQKTCQALGWDSTYEYTEDDERVTIGLLLTTEGQFEVAAHENLTTGDVYLNWQVEADSLRSNTIPSCLWLPLQRRVDNILLALSFMQGQGVTYNGTVTAANVDALLLISFVASDGLVEELTYDDERVWFDGDDMRAAFRELFGVTPDLTLSSGYDAVENTVCISIDEDNIAAYEKPFEMEQTADGYVARVKWVDPDTMQLIKLDEDLRLVSFGPDASNGDMNADGKLDMRDAFALYIAASGGASLTDVQKSVADMNGDGKYDMRDAFALYKIVSGG